MSYVFSGKRTAQQRRDDSECSFHHLASFREQVRRSVFCFTNSFGGRAASATHFDCTADDCLCPHSRRSVSAFERPLHAHIDRCCEVREWPFQTNERQAPNKALALMSFPERTGLFCGLGAHSAVRTGFIRRIAYTVSDDNEAKQRHGKNSQHRTDLSEHFGLT